MRSLTLKQLLFATLLSLIVGCGTYKNLTSVSPKYFGGVDETVDRLRQIENSNEFDDTPDNISEQVFMPMTMTAGLMFRTVGFVDILLSAVGDAITGPVVKLKKSKK